jgi:hypothetical protein
MEETAVLFLPVKIPLIEEIPYHTQNSCNTPNRPTGQERLPDISDGKHSNISSYGSKYDNKCAEQPETHQVKQFGLVHWSPPKVFIGK